MNETSATNRCGRARRRMVSSASMVWASSWARTTRVPARSSVQSTTPSKSWVPHVGIGLDYVFDRDELTLYLEQNRDTFPIGSGYSEYSSYQFVSPAQLPEVTESLLALGYTEEAVRASWAATSSASPTRLALSGLRSVRVHALPSRTTPKTLRKFSPKMMTDSSLRRAARAHA